MPPPFPSKEYNSITFWTFRDLFLLSPNLAQTPPLRGFFRPKFYVPFFAASFSFCGNPPLFSFFFPLNPHTPSALFLTPVRNPFPAHIHSGWSAQAPRAKRFALLPFAFSSLTIYPSPPFPIPPWPGFVNTQSAYYDHAADLLPHRMTFFCAACAPPPVVLSLPPWSRNSEDSSESR